MPFQQPVPDLIIERYSCRTYREETIAPQAQAALDSFASNPGAAPFGSTPRFSLVSASDEDSQALRGLGTYGFIKGATGYIIGAMQPTDHNLEDFGYLMERIILVATGLGLGTCWLGGTFTKSRFARRIGATGKESVPAVTSVGYAARDRAVLDTATRLVARSNQRLPREQLFFDRSWDTPLSEQAAGDYDRVLEMVRIGPSASNKQPWRIVRDGDCWHLYLQRTPGYRRGLLMRLFDIADMQRIDMGIAMGHFEWTAQELGLAGHWEVSDPRLPLPDNQTEYTVTWKGT